MNKLLNVILDEQKFPYENMSLEERNYYLNIIKNCKDINDSEHKIDGQNQCQILELRFKKMNSQVYINGTLSIGTENIREGRCIDGYILIENNSIIVDYHITRLLENTKPMEYTVLDEFKIVNGRLTRNSYYNYNMKNIETQLDDEMMKGMLK